MRILTIVILALLILSCEKQPMIFEPDTKVSQSVPAGQIGPQIDTLFSSWREFANDPDPYCMSVLNQHYKNQMDNGLFGILIGLYPPHNMFLIFGNVTKDTEKWAQYKSLTFSFTFVTTGLFDRYGFMIDFWHYEGGGQWNPIAYSGYPFIGPNDSTLISYTFYLDSIWTQYYSYKDLNSMSITYYNTLMRPKQDTNLIYSAYVSELLVTGERRQDAQGKGE